MLIILKVLSLFFAFGYVLLAIVSSRNAGGPQFATYASVGLTLASILAFVLLLKEKAHFVSAILAGVGVFIGSRLVMIPEQYGASLSSCFPSYI